MQYKYKTVKAPRRRGQYRKKREKLLNKMATGGWELFHVSEKKLLEFGWKDTLTFRRQKG